MNYVPAGLSGMRRGKAHNPFAKRAFDLLVAASALFVLSPLLLIAALAIKLTSDGPVFFRQPRYGRDWRVFNVYKLRTLDHDRCDAPGARVVKPVGEHDSRVFPVGRFLRARGIDEIPQLWNVVRGDMSIVGPRPHALPHDDYYRANIPGYALRYIVRPGITGWAQVNGSRGQIRNLDDARQRLIFDLHYIERASVLFDFEICLRTAQILVLGTDPKPRYPRLPHSARAARSPAAVAHDRVEQPGRRQHRLPDQIGSRR